MIFFPSLSPHRRYGVDLRCVLFFPPFSPLARGSLFPSVVLMRSFKCPFGEPFGQATKIQIAQETMTLFFIETPPLSPSSYLLLKSANAESILLSLFEDTGRTFLLRISDQISPPLTKSFPILIGGSGICDPPLLADPPPPPTTRANYSPHLLSPQI